MQMLAGRPMQGQAFMAVDGSPLDDRHFRNALGRFVTGVTVITTRTADGKLEGLTANSFSAVSLDPPLVLWSLRMSSTLMTAFQGAGHFAVNVLGAWQAALSDHFAKRMPDKFQNVVHAPGLAGCPLLFGALATFECIKEANVTSGDHIVFFGRVERATYREGEPLIFSAGRYGTHAFLD
jgi:flavin reductase (DIM6/NTAB) family NADH-FMN oxidoreductase RutF